MGPDYEVLYKRLAGENDDASKSLTVLVLLLILFPPYVPTIPPPLVAPKPVNSPMTLNIKKDKGFISSRAKFIIIKTRIFLQKITRVDINVGE